MTIHALLAIKTRRVEHQKQQLNQQRLKMESLSHTCQQSTETYHAFQQWRTAEETRIFEICKATVMNQKALALWQQQISFLRKQEGERAATLAEHQAQLAIARKQYQTGLQQYQAASRQAKKYQQISQNFLTQEQQQQELKEEQQMEEVRRGEIICSL